MGARGEGAVLGGDAEAEETKVPHEVEVVQSAALLALQVYGVDEALLYQVLHVRVCVLVAPHVRDARVQTFMLTPAHAIYEMEGWCSRALLMSPSARLIDSISR